ncbi:a915fc4c-a007-43ad-8b74-a33949b7a2de [Thermothielavioides terrestris]|uniref:lytic cellulose monooxygenase (C4-dehydrogenating) n=2 Tax=Thermothielavioides terrestris TaxID=2587410 RepID=G2R1U0_THETT|nr:glyoside hydrolase family 61 protein [Thermothielavioides terrestris NRRL 8126]AEO67395.1 glyoside hydrolase family 61 protein [Thermothielavioides terrestris NRRL 8126]SPQ19834.1 a915fc4c-a007-43ad-8b74-a33949b7a2de [Thermothielavioides terrestris]
MRTTFAAALAAFAAQEVAGHAIFQQLWHGSSCVRMPLSNSPVTNVGSRDMICNAGTRPVSGKCPVKAGGTVTVEMHQQPGDRSCNNEAIGGAHWGPVQVYLSKVEDASTADGSTGWFKIFADTWSKKAGSSVGDDDNWGTRDLNACCGKMQVKIPADIPSGDYLLRAEALALHTAGQVGGAQFYMSCYQITVSGGGSASPATVKFPGAYSANDPGIHINIHAAVSNYVAPGPAVYSGGTTKVAGSGCQGCENTCKVGSSPTATAPSGKSGAGSDGGAGTDGGSSSSSPDTGSACSVQAYGQCGGNGYSGCTQCAPGYTCKAVSPPYYSQCAPSS